MISTFKKALIPCFLAALIFSACQITNQSKEDKSSNVLAKQSLTGIDKAISVQKKNNDALLATADIVGTAVGRQTDGQPVIYIFTSKKGKKGLPASFEGIPVTITYSGVFKALKKPPKPPKPDPDPSVDPTSRFERPVPIGVSTGHPNITAGTIGARVTDGVDVYALSNNHVYADENLANVGDQVIQPGTFDNGTAPADVIGTLFAYQPIDFTPGAPNVIDAAIALVTTSTLGKATPSDGYGMPRSIIQEADVNLSVKKYGRTTGFTKGKVYALNASVNVQYSAGTALFDGQIIISPGAFSSGGDSGSLIVVDGKGRTKSLDRRPVGLLFAGSDLYTIANPIDEVLGAFGVTIDGE